jgi:outer membrane lipoprotein-sorting protein
MLVLATGGFIAIVMGLTAGAAAPRANALSAREILDCMAKAYAGSKSYRDTGVVTTVFVKATGTLTVEKPFKTAFVRPDRFRFEYTEKGRGGDDRYIVWRKGAEVRTWWDVEPGIEEAATLDAALAAATGVSGSSAHRVPALLLPNEIRGRGLTELTDPRRASDARIDKADRFRIEGGFAGDPMTLWIDTTTFLVRRIEAKHQFADFRTEATTTYDPVIDAEILDGELEFNAPPGK